MWLEQDDQLKKDFTFNSFSEAFAFLVQVALLSEKNNHHPEIHFTFKKVTITLTTHDDGNVVTQKDRAMAKEIEKIISN